MIDTVVSVYIAQLVSHSDCAIHIYQAFFSTLSMVLSKPWVEEIRGRTL